MFCAGADLKERKGMSQLESVNFVKTLRRLFHEFSQIHCPTISLIDGATLGGGLELALSTDIRVATEQSIIGLPETSLAIIPGAGGTQTLSRIVGEAVAKELIFTGDRISPQRALDLGIVNYVEKDNESAYQKVVEIANKICKNGPIGVRMAKMAISKGIDVSKESGLKIEELCYAQVLNTSDRLEGLKAFAEKRKPEYKGE
jgi:methylglutaconyl-CoA hydratase